MKDQSKTKQALIQELASLRQRIAELEQSESECKRAEESETKYRKLHESMMDGFVFVSMDGIIKEYNKSFLEMLGYTGEEILKLSYRDLTPAKWHSFEQNIVERQILTQEYSEVYEKEYRKKDGTVFPVELRTFLIKDETGSNIGMWAIVRDITERKHAEEALRERDIQFKKFSSWVPGMIYQFTKRPDGTYYVPFTTEAIKDIFGCSPQDVREDFSPIARVILPEDFDKVVGSIEFSAKHLTKWTCEYRVQIPSQSIRWILGHSTPEKLVDGGITWYGFNTDITERKQTEDKISESELHYRQLADDMPALMCTFLPDSTLTYVNKTYCELFQKSPAELVGQKFLDFLPDEAARENVRSHYMSLTPDNPVKTYEHKVMVSDGTGQHHWHRWTDRAFFKDNGEISHFQSIGQDMTTHKQVEDALRMSEERFRRLSEAAFEAIAIHEEGVLLNANDQFFKMFGYEPGEVLGKQVMPMTVAPEAREFMTKQIATCGLGPYESIGLRKDGTRFPIEIHTRQIEYKGRNVRVGVIVDITESKRAEEELKASENKYRYLVENINDIIFKLNNEGRFTYMNPVAEHVLGYSPIALIGHPFSELIYPEDLPLVITAFNNVQSGILKYEEYRVFNKSGDICWIRSSSRPNYSKGKVDGIIGIAVDITEQKQAEEKLRVSHFQLRALAKHLQHIREEERLIVAREIHDEMGGGLTGLKMDLSWLSCKIDDADRGEERVALMDKIQTSNALIDHMIHIVRRISTDLRPSVLDDLGLIAALEWQLTEFTGRTEIPHEFTTTFEYVNVQEDTAIAVFRIFQEALTNVARHSRATKVAVVLRESERSLFGDESLVLEIRDNGRGITEEEVLNQESFGLLGMKERVLAFGGELSIHGEPGDGTTLILKIPLIQGEPS
jgi:PAS domain S-box-containing protein